MLHSWPAGTAPGPTLPTSHPHRPVAGWLLALALGLLGVLSPMTQAPAQPWVGPSDSTRAPSAPATTPDQNGAPRVETGETSGAVETAPAPARGIATGDGLTPLPASPPPPAAEPPTETAAPGNGATNEGEAEAEALRLLELLRDVEVRNALLDAIRRLDSNGAPTAEAAEDPSAHATDEEAGAPAFYAAAEDSTAEAPAPVDEPRDSLGRRIAETTTTAAKEIVEEIIDFWNGLAVTQRRLAGFARADTDGLSAIAKTVGFTVATTIGTLFLLRLVARPVWRRLGVRFVEGGLTVKVLVFSASVLIDALTILLAWASGYAIGLFAWGTGGEIEIHVALFLNAFLGVEMVKLGLRSVLAPGEPRLRPMPINDTTARYWSRWSSVLISVLGYGLLLIVPIVDEEVNIFTGRATAVLIYAVVLLTTAALVIWHRRDPVRYFEAQAEAQDGDVTMRVLAVLAQYVWLGILAYLVALTVFAVTQQGNVGPIVRETLTVIGVVLLGAVVATGLNRAGERGVKVPAAINNTLPMLERRLNTFVPAFLKLMRFVILVAVVAAAVEILDLFDIQAWLDSAVGGDAAGRIVSVIMMVLAAFVIWLALASWVDYRLRPRGYRPVTAREQTLLSLLRNAATIAIIVITLMFSLSEIGIDIAPLIASAGVLGLAIGFGAQKMVQDIIGGIFIQFENAINVGDVITVGGTTGTVEKLTIRSVSLRDLEGVFHVIPFSSVDMVSNYMRGFAYHVADLGIAYREDIDEAKALMERCFADMRSDPAWRHQVIGDFEWFGVQALGDSAVVLRGRIKTTPGNQWGVGRQYNERLKKACDEAGIEIPFPHMTIWMGEAKDGAAPPVQVRHLRAPAPEVPDIDSPGPHGTPAEAAMPASVRPRQDVPTDES